MSQTSGKNKSEKTLKIEDLNQLYDDAVSVDRDIFAEQRSNVMLIAGNHYSGKGSKNWARLRDIRDVPGEQKLRLTKNHIHVVTKTHLNYIVNSAPNVKIVPRNERELQDIKCAELNDSVWQYACDTLDMQKKIFSLAKDFVEIGECGTKTFFNPYAGKFKGYNQAVDELTGEPMVDENGQMVPDHSSPVFEGLLEIEKILPSNLLRDAAATSMFDSPWLGIRKMVPVKVAKKLVPEDDERQKFIEPSQRDEYMVFDSNVGDYKSQKDQVMIREYYFRPSVCYPQGYFFITTKDGILFEGELPFGVFPIDYEGFDEMQSSPRHRSIVKQLRPYQIEMNRTASKIAETQVTSDDKLIIQGGAKMASGGVLPGVRAIQVTGPAPTVLEGRSGSQYLEYYNSQVSELYRVGMIAEQVEKESQQADPYGMLFRSVREQKKFTIYIEKFSGFLKRMATTYLTLAKRYYTDDMLIPAIGKSEYINIPEFRSTEDIRTQIRVMPMSDDVNSMFGKWLAINHMIQYASQALSKEDIGRLARNIPYGNFDESFSDVTMNYDLATNYILALERGQFIPPSPADDKTYMIKRLEKRMRESDFRFLHPQIQQYFEQAKQAYTDMDVQEKLALQRAEQGFIPTTGPLIKTDLQVNLPNTTGGFKTTRATFPVDALSWLQKQLEAQGSNFESFQTLGQSTQADEANRFIQQSQVPIPGNGPEQTGPAPVQGGMNGIGKPNQFN